MTKEGEKSTIVFVGDEENGEDCRPLQKGGKKVWIETRREFHTCVETRRPGKGNSKRKKNEAWR